MRGNGESDGLMWDEYLKQEQDDALEVIDWLVKQPWCSGTVGMIGISWGGFNGLQVAMRRPPALKAVISIASTVDRYADDIHYKGGCLLNDNLDWSTTMLSLQLAPARSRAGGPALARHVAGAPQERAAAARESGCAISIATPSGSMARSARTGRRSRRRCWRSAAGPTPIPMPCPSSAPS